MKNKTYIEHDAMKQPEGKKGGRKMNTIDLILLRVTPKTRETLIKFMNGTVDLYGKDFADALNELAELDRKTSASYEELMADMFDDVLK